MLGRSKSNSLLESLLNLASTQRVVDLGERLWEWLLLDWSAAHLCIEQHMNFVLIMNVQVERIFNEASVHTTYLVKALHLLSSELEVERLKVLF